MYCFVCVCVCFLFVDMLYIIYNIFLELFDIFLKDSKGFFEFLYIFIMYCFFCVSVFYIGSYVLCLKKLYFFLKSIDNRFMML